MAKGNDSANIPRFDEFADVQAGRYENVNWGAKWEQEANATSEDKSGALWDLLTEWVHNPRPEYNAFFNKKGNRLEEETRDIIEEAYEYAKVRGIEVG